MRPNPQIPGIWSHLLNNSLMENFIFCAVLRLQAGSFRVHQIFKPKNVFSAELPYRPHKDNLDSINLFRIN